MLEADKYNEFRQRVIESFDVYDLVEYLDLTVADWLDNTTGWEDNIELQFECGMITEEEFDNAQGRLREV